jgi:hypothetical protein
MPRPKPTRLYHFTHLANLASIVEGGLLCETAGAERCAVDVGSRGIKDQRRRRPVAVEPGGYVADYAPFYFAPRSPMLRAIVGGRVPEYGDGQDPLVYLLTTVERLVELGLTLVFTDRNAAVSLADFTTEVDSLDSFVDWPLMHAKMWNNTAEDPDRRERRMAECLVHEGVPWGAFNGVATRTRMRRAEVQAVLAGTGLADRVEVRPGWYF